MIPFLGWVLGVVLVWLSRIWSTRDKLAGALGVYLGFRLRARTG